MTSTPTPQTTPRSGRSWQILLIVGAAVVATGGLLWGSNALFPTVAPDPGAHSNAVDSAVGEPGNPQLPARVVDVAMIETADGMKFEPSALEVKVGDQVRFKITNTGTLQHEFILSTLTDNLQHLEAMKKLPGMVHSGVNAITLAPGASGEVFWHFTRPGSFDFSCLIPGHRESGMHGAVVVK